MVSRSGPARYVPDRDGFHAARRRGNLITIHREIIADGYTPVSAFARLGARDYGFLLESVVGGDKWAAYSFIGVAPRAVLRVAGGRAEITRFGIEGEAAVTVEDAPDPVAALGGFVAGYRAVADAALPRFFGGAVGYLAYDAVRAWEPIPAHAPAEGAVPDAVFIATDTLVIFDNLRQTVKVVASAHVPAPDAHTEADRAYDAACARIDAIVETLRTPGAPLPTLDLEAAAAPSLQSRTTRADFLAAVQLCKDHILAGDAFQIVLSQRFEAALGGADPFDAYRALRVINPSPYMFHIQLPELTITGASPEALVRLEGRRIELRPLAGTRPRGHDPAEDARLEAELRADEKERAEHVMLIDLGRNDVGRVSRVGSVRVEETMVVERYSHVMHLVSLVSGELAEDKTALDVLRAAFPAGTLSGAPKLRAMQIIDELEPVRRGVYGGAVGYLSYPTDSGATHPDSGADSGATHPDSGSSLHPDSGATHPNSGATSNLDLAIAIRTLVTRGDRVLLQAGAGIVSDSIPEAEFDETVNKARAAARALEIARTARR